MKLILGTWVLFFSSISMASPYIGIGLGKSVGSDWDNEAPTIYAGYRFAKNWSVESAMIDLGRRSSWPHEKVRGQTLEASYSVTLNTLLFAIGTGVYTYSSDYQTGDFINSTYEISPLFSTSMTYEITSNISTTLKARKLFLGNSSGNPIVFTLGFEYEF